MKQGLTYQAGEFLMAVIEKGTPGQNNPFVYRDNKLYMLFDAIQVKNATLIHNTMERNTDCVNVCYYWKGELLNVTLVQQIGLTTNQLLCLDGFEGAMGINNKDQFSMNTDELSTHIDQVKDHLECMTDKQLDVMLIESEQYGNDNIFKQAIMDEIEKRPYERKDD